MKQWLPEQLETVSCDLCGAASAQSKYKRGDGMTVIQCPQCGLAFQNLRVRASSFKAAREFQGQIQIHVLMNPSKLKIYDNQAVNIMYDIIFPVRIFTR